MRHVALIPVVGLSLIALIAACATSPEDDTSNVTASSANAPDEENPGAKLPPPSQTDSKDAGTTTTKDAGTKPVADSGTTTDAGTSSSSSSGSSGSTDACDMSNPIIAALYTYQFSQITTPEFCPCVATKCCYGGIACLDK